MRFRNTKFLGGGSRGRRLQVEPRQRVAPGTGNAEARKGQDSETVHLHGPTRKNEGDDPHRRGSHPTFQLVASPLLHKKLMVMYKSLMHPNLPG